MSTDILRKSLLRSIAQMSLDQIDPEQSSEHHEAVVEQRIKAMMRMYLLGDNT